MYPHPQPLDSKNCCNICNPNLYATLDELPKEEETTTKLPKPGAKTRPGCAMLMIKAWCYKQADRLFPGDRMFPLSSDFFLSGQLIFSLGSLFRERDLDVITEHDVEIGAPLFQEWYDAHKAAGTLPISIDEVVTELNNLVHPVLDR